MPTYRYECDCTKGNYELVMSIADMEVYERESLPKCVCFDCRRPMRRSLAMQRPIMFHEGFYEHVCDEGAYVSNMSDLRRIAREAGNYSQYAEDMAGAFRAKEGRWI